MRRGRMFLAQDRMNEVILYCILADVILGYILKKYQGPGAALPLMLLYLMNAVVIAGVYRFWKVPIFEWDETGFTSYGVSPFRKEKSAWRMVERAGFQAMEVKKGKAREFLVIHYVTAGGQRRTNLVPMYMVGFRDRLKEEMQAFLKEKGVRPL